MRHIFIPKSFNKLITSQKGSIAFYILLLIVLGFGVLLAGGGPSLLSGDTPSPVNATPTPTLVPGAPTPTPTTVPSTWSISYALEPCANGERKGKALTKAESAGYMSLEISNGEIYVPIDTGTSAVLLPEGEHPIFLRNSKGFNSKPWRVALYSGGTLTDGQWTGGILEAERKGIATGC